LNAVRIAERFEEDGLKPGDGPPFDGNLRRDQRHPAIESDVDPVGILVSLVGWFVS